MNNKKRKRKNRRYRVIWAAGNHTRMAKAVTPSLALETVSVSVMRMHFVLSWFQRMVTSWFSSTRQQRDTSSITIQIIWHVHFMWLSMHQPLSKAHNVLDTTTEFSIKRSVPRVLMTFFFHRGCTRILQIDFIPLENKQDVWDENNSALGDKCWTCLVGMFLACAYTDV
jgi:hypothetical protein